MPTQAQIEAQARKREERKVAAEKQANLEAQLLASASQEQEKTKLKPGSLVGQKTGTKETRAQRARKEREAAKAQADIDVARTAAEVDADLSKYPDGKVPLPVLNALASKADAAIRDEAKDIANAAGRAAFDTAVGKISKRTIVNRMRRTAEFQTAASKAQQASEQK